MTWRNKTMSEGTRVSCSHFCMIASLTMGANRSKLSNVELCIWAGCAMAMVPEETQCYSIWFWKKHTQRVYDTYKSILELNFKGYLQCNVLHKQSIHKGVLLSGLQRVSRFPHSMVFCFTSNRHSHSRVLWHQSCYANRCSQLLDCRTCHRNLDKLLFFGVLTVLTVPAPFLTVPAPFLTVPAPFLTVPGPLPRPQKIRQPSECSRSRVSVGNQNGSDAQTLALCNVATCVQAQS